MAYTYHGTYVKHDYRRHQGLRNALNIPIVESKFQSLIHTGCLLQAVP